MFRDRILTYDYYAEVSQKLMQEVGPHFNLSLNFYKYTPDKENPKMERLASFAVAPENKEEINRYLNDYVYSEENLTKPYKEYQCLHSIGAALPPDKEVIYKKIVYDYLR